MGGSLLLLALALLPPEEPAARALALWRAGDRAALGALARADGADPWAIADALLGLHAAGTEGARDAAAALAEEAGLPALVRVTLGWKRLGPEDLARERRLREALARFDEARERGAWREALQRADDAEADRATAPEGSLAAIRLLERRARVLNELGLLEEAAAAAARAVRAANASGDRRVWAEAQATSGIIASNQGRHGEAARHFDQALGVPSFLPPPELLVKVGKLHADLRQHERALGYYRRALKGTPEGVDRMHVANVLLDVGTVLSNLGRRAEAVQHFERARAMALRLGHRHFAAFVLANQAVIHFQARELDEARAVGEAALAELERHGTRSEVAWARQGLGSAYSESGDPDRALRCFEESLRDQRALGAVSDEMDTLINIAALEERLGRFGPARAAARAALDLQGRVGGGLGLADAEALRGQTRLAAELGFRAAAEALRATAAPEDAAAGLRADVLWFAESGRALLLAEELRNREAFVRVMLEPSLRAALDAADGRRAAARRRLLELDARPSAGGPELERAQAAWEAAGKESHVGDAFDHDQTHKYCQAPRVVLRIQCCPVNAPLLAKGSQIACLLAQALPCYY